jgi:hypothetical protein
MLRVGRPAAMPVTPLETLKMRGRAIAILTAGLLLVPAAAWAQDPATPEPDESGHQTAVAEPTPEHTSGIGDSGTSVVCTGTVAVSVVDLDGAPVSGAVMNVAGTQVFDGGSVTTACGEHGASLLAAPEGYAPASATSTSVRVTNGAVTALRFVVDPVEVLGVALEQPAATPAPTAPTAAPRPADTTAAPQPEAPTLAETGPEQGPELILLALLFGFAGVALLQVAEGLRR